MGCGPVLRRAVCKSDLTRVRAIVRGRVQGVFFRDFARKHAQRLGLVGWVRNLSDGMSVEVIAEGPPAALQELVAHLRRGPAGAYVQANDVKWEPARSEFSSFRVR